MAAWFGDSYDRTVISNLEWVPTSFFERIKFFITRKPDYRFKTRYFDEEFSDIDNLKSLTVRMRDSGFTIDYQEYRKNGWGDMTRFLALDQTTTNCVTIMQ